MIEKMLREYVAPFVAGFVIVHIVVGIVVGIAGCDAAVVSPDGGPGLSDAPPTDAPPTDAPPADASPADDAGTPEGDAPAPVDAPVLADTPPIDTSTPEGFARRAAELLCAAWAVCDGCTAPSATCVETMAARILDAEPRENFHPSEVDAYLAVLEDAYGRCEQVAPQELEGYPFDGGREIGEPCDAGRDCITRSCQSTGGVATCREVVPVSREALCR